KKVITDKQLRYIINQVYIPKITYLLNDMTLSTNTCNKFQSKISKTIKHKLGLATTTPNTVLYNPLEYGFFQIWERQIIHHGTNWQIRINSPNHAGILTRIRTQETQNIYWSTHSFTSLHLTQPFIQRGKNLTHDIVFLLRQHGFNFNTPFIITPKKIDTTLEETMSPQWIHKHRTQLRKNQIIFLGQCLNANNT